MSATAAKWIRRYRQGGVPGLRDRSSEMVARVEALRRERWMGQRSALQMGLSRATVSRIHGRLWLNRMRDLEPKSLVHRYEHAAAGDLLHLDIKKLGRIVRPSQRVTGNRRDSVDGAGWEYVHMAIDDHSRIAFSAIYLDETQGAVLELPPCCSGVLRTARHPLQGRAHRQRSRLSLTRHGPTLPCAGPEAPFYPAYTPRTNGKAERFIQTALREWPYARTYQNSSERSHQLRPWLYRYNWHRPHASLGLSPPISRAALDRNNLLRLHS